MSESRSALTATDSNGCTSEAEVGVSQPLDADLQTIIERWAELPAALRADRGDGAEYLTHNASAVRNCDNIIAMLCETEQAPSATSELRVSF